jgi:uncharacterized OsmC-like protein
MRRMTPTLIVEALDPGHGRRTSITWVDADFHVSGDNHVAHGGGGTGPDGFDLVAAALGQCLLNTLLARIQRDRVAVRSAQAMVATKTRLRGAGVAPYLSDFEVDLYIDADIDEATREELERATASLCGVRETLSQSPQIQERVHIGRAPPAP